LVKLDALLFLLFGKNEYANWLTGTNSGAMPRPCSARNSATCIHDLDGISNTVDRLKQLLANFVERRGIIPGGCPLLNTAIDSDDGNSVLRERARKALRSWRNYLISIIRTGIKAREIRSNIDAQKLATLIISALEGAVRVYRLERTEEPLSGTQAHLDNYLETEVRSPSK